jgi:MFS family permease
VTTTRTASVPTDDVPPGGGADEAGARVRAGWVVPVHVLAIALIQSTWMGATFITPVLARKEFGAGYWQTLLITAAPTVFFTLSIFWNDLFKRRAFGKYMLTYWLLASAPGVLISLASGYWGLLVPHLIMCIGGAGLHPATGEMLKWLYPDRVRGRIYSTIWGCTMFCGAFGGLGVGHWLDADHEAFRIIYPAAAGLQLAGVGVFVWLSRATGHGGERTHDAAKDRRTMWTRVVEPIGHMREVLAADPIFARYEAGFMTYGVGWMICAALLPIVVTDGLHLEYGAIAESTHVAYWLAMTAMIVPAGMLMDRIGAVRCTGVSFGLLTLYPVGLMLSADAHQLLLTSVVYGVVHSGASVGWMLGPVSFAPRPAKVPQYLAIHATLVGIRGTVFQLVGVGLYWWTHQFWIPLTIAAGAMVWSAWQMWALDRRMRGDRRGAGRG